MRIRLLPACVLAVAPGIAAAPSVAGVPVSGVYVGLGGGADFLQDEIVNPSNAYGPSKRAYQFDTGGAGAAALGYGFGNGLRLEVQGDYTYNHVSGVRFPSGVPGRAIGHEQQYGGFVNALYDLDLGLPVTPYLGIGAGYQQVELDRVGSGVAGSRVRSDLISSEGAFAYQAIAGASYGIAAVPGLSLTAEYRMTGVLTPPPFYRGEATILRPTSFVPRLSFDTVHEVSRGEWSNIFNHEVLIGLRYAFGARMVRHPAAPPPTVAAPAPEAARTYLVFFDWDRSDLPLRARQIVAEAAQASTRIGTTRIEVDGYTDRSGTAAYNRELSVRRARSVEAELLRDGVGRDQIGVRGYGESSPLVQTGPGVREPQNRRVEIILR